MIALDEGQAAGLGIVLATTGIFFGFRLVRKLRLEWILASKLRQPTVDELLEFQGNAIRQDGALPETPFLRALSRSIALAYYGHSIGSMNAVNAFDMSEKPVFRTMQQQAEVINNFLQRQELPESLAIARQCVQDVQSRNPSSNINLTKSHETWVEVGEVLNNVSTQQTIGSLERRFRKSTFLLRPPIAWALCIAYKRQGDNDRSKKFKNWLLRTVPYCTPFLNTD